MSDPGTRSDLDPADGDLGALEVALGVPPTPPPPAPATPPIPPAPPGADGGAIAVWRPPGERDLWAPPGASEPFRPLRGLATALTWLLGLTVPLNLASVVAQLQQRAQIDQVWDGDEIVGTFSDFDRLDTLEQRAGALLGVGFLATVAIGVVFIIWLWRARKNVEGFGARPERGAGWAIGSWFVPCGNLVLPVLVTSDTWKGTTSGAERPRSRAIVGIWWAAFLPMSALLQWGSSTDPDFEDVPFGGLADAFDQYRSARTMFALYSTFAVLAAVAAIALVRALTAMQHERHEAAAANLLTPPTPA